MSTQYLSSFLFPCALVIMKRIGNPAFFEFFNEFYFERKVWIKVGCRKDEIPIPFGVMQHLGRMSETIKSSIDHPSP